MKRGCCDYLAGAEDPDGAAEGAPLGTPSGIEGGLGIESPQATTKPSARARAVTRSETATVVFFMM
jgi:hypothetical protein